MNSPKDKLIVSQSMKIFDLEMSLATCKTNLTNAVRGQLEYKEILHDIGDLINYQGNSHNLVGIIREQRWRLKTRGIT